MGDLERRPIEKDRYKENRGGEGERLVDRRKEGKRNER